ncbi:MAG: c-type cytochrome [Thiobacillus sp.]|nr:c-type cytochrome [Thiobacillus sp.]
MKSTLIHLALTVFVALPAQAAAPSTQATHSDADMVQLLAARGDPAKGQEAYVICRGCHRADASGKAEAGYPQLAGQHPSVIIKQMLDVRAGRRDSPRMHPFITSEVVPGEDIAHIAAYLYTLPVPASNGKGSGRLLDLGRHLYERDCASCHGKHGEGDGARFYPRVAGQHYAYLLRESRESRDKGRRNSHPEMVRLIRHYSDDDLAAVSDYMSRLAVPTR